MAAGTFHVYAHSVWTSVLFRDDADRITFLRQLAATTARIGGTCISYCLLTTHYHLIVDVDDGELPVAMHALNFKYAMAFNGRHAMKGHVQGARYDSVRIRDESHLISAYRYVARNPVRAGLCESPLDWPWSSYRHTVELDDPSFVDPSLVLGCFDGSREEMVKQLRDVVEEP